MRRTVWFWRGVEGLVGRLRRDGFPLNRAVNEALLFWMGVQGDEVLRLRARLALLRREEMDLRQSMRVMLRSGSYLPQYADKLFRERYDGGSSFFVRRGQVPLKALSVAEEDVARRVLAERERIAGEIADVLGKLLPKKRFRLKPSRSPYGEKKKRRAGVKPRETKCIDSDSPKRRNV